jgi:NADPH:quinone reductase-like Zn-dependent oxidoreductase
MLAIVQDTYGAADVLELRDIDKPVVGDEDLLIRVHAAGVDPGVWHLMTGRPFLLRIMGYGLRKPQDPHPGPRCRRVGGGSRHQRDPVPPG